MREQEEEIIECRECGTTFNLAAQFYYDNKCPSCVEADEPKRSWPSCIRCGEKYEPGTGVSTTVTNRSMRGGTERVVACSDECASKLGRGRP